MEGAPLGDWGEARDPDGRACGEANRTLVPRVRDAGGVEGRLTGEGLGEELGDCMEDTEVRDGDCSRLATPFPLPLASCTCASSTDNNRSVNEQTQAGSDRR